MTAKEKAQAIFDNIRETMNNTLDVSYPYLSVENIDVCAKMICVICVDEIINSDPSSPYGDGFYELHSDRIEDVKIYWEQVKQEINLL